jgi:hypothetical protein
MTDRTKSSNPQPRGEVRFQASAAKIVAERPNDDEELEELKNRLSDDDGFPPSCGGV